MVDDNGEREREKREERKRKREFFVLRILKPNQ